MNLNVNALARAILWLAAFGAAILLAGKLVGGVARKASTAV